MDEEENEYSFIPKPRTKKVLRFDSENEDEEEDISKPPNIDKNQNNEANLNSTINQTVNENKPTQNVKPIEKNEKLVEKENRKSEVNGVNKTINSDNQSMISTQAPTVNSQNTKNDKNLLEKRTPNNQDMFPAPPSKKINVEKKVVKHSSDAKRSVEPKPHASKSKNDTSHAKDKDEDQPFYKKYGKRNYEFKQPKTKHELVYEILKRWWYALPDWPEQNVDYKEQLDEKKLRLVKENFNFEPEQDDKGFAKVKELEGYTGVFIDSKGKTTDLRDRTMCPSFSNLKKKEIRYLVGLLLKALRNQIAELKVCTHPDHPLESELGKLLEKVKKGYSQYLVKKDE